MMSIRTILTIASYEGKVLWRNWFFRIIALAGLFFVSIFNLVVFSELDDGDWKGLSNGWVLPYASMLLISMPQAAAVVFLATGLIKKDKKLDTNEVFFVRPITNLDYVLGKALALIKLFVLLNLVLLCIPLIVGLTSPVATINLQAFIIYPVLTSIPSIVFVTGISFLLVTLIRNQPISIVLLVGLAGVQLIYYFDKFSNILDFTSFRLPMLASEMTGFVDLEFALLQRAFYLVTGIAFLFFTAFVLDRLASHKRTHRSTALFGTLFFAASAVIMFNLWSARQATLTIREQMISVNGEWAGKPNATVTSHDISFEWRGNEFFSTSTMQLINHTGQTLDTMYFTLNPGLEVGTVMLNNIPVQFERHLHLLTLTDKVRVEDGERVSVTVTYHGTIDQSLAHLDVEQERYESSNDFLMFSLLKKYAYLQEDYVLLTKDVYWYPDTQIGYNRKSAAKERNSFIDFKLKVKAPSGMMPISQGALSIKDDIYHFSPEFPLPNISLVIGDYEKKNITVGGIEYAVYHYPKNDFFLTQLDQLADTVGHLITDVVNEYEDAQRLSYPFKRMQFVEVPVHFSAYNKVYEGHQAFVQPETVFWPEEGGEISQFDFRGRLKDMNEQAAKMNQVMTDKQKQANVFNNLVRKVFTKQIGSKWVYDGKDVDIADYCVFPNYYDFNSGIVSKDFTLLNRSIATYLRNDKQVQKDYSREINGISFTEECNELMRKASITKILTEQDFSKINKAVTLKSKYLFSYVGQLIGEARFKSFLYDWVNTHQHQLVSYEDFRKALISHFNVDLDPVIQKVYAETSQPAFEIVDVQKYEVMDGDRKRYQVLLTAKNSGKSDGVLEVKFNNKKGKDDEDDDYYASVNEEAAEETPGRLSVLKAGETKLLGFILDEKPGDLTVNTIISHNIPSIINIPMGTLTKHDNNLLFDGEKVLETDNNEVHYELIVDNEDPQFTHFSPIKPTMSKAYLDAQHAKDQKYFGVWSSSYSKWLATTGSDYYGTIVRSAHFARSGNGEKIATWNAELKEEGFYDVYVYMKGKNQNEYTGSNKDGRQFDYHYIVRNGDGVDNIKFNISNAEPGWNYLGSYYFEKTGGSVSLTDECDMRSVYADAVKWVKQ